MKKLLLILPVLFHVFIFAQTKPMKTPIDPDFHISPMELQEMKENGIVLPPIRPLHDPYKNYTYRGPRDFPETYDMRDSSWLTPVKSQSAGGCWAYSTMGAVESRLLMLGSGTYNLSDNNLKYCHKYLPERSTNGNHWMSSAYFARRSGPYLETEDPYPGGTTGPENCPNDLSAQFYVHQSRYPPSQDINAMKQTVLDYGAVWSLLYWNSNNYNTEDYTYYYSGTHAVNHAGCVVGWNDTLTTPGGAGAWIVRNTWGQGWGEGGYYYISYNDSQFLKYNSYWPEFMENEPNTTIYQYDEIGGYWSVGTRNEFAYGLVAFDGPPDDMEISKIGTFALYAGSSIEIMVYDHFNSSLSGLLGLRDEEIVDLPGYYTFDLDSPIFIPAGEDFYVQIKYDSNDPDFEWPIPVEDTIAGYSEPEIETGRFWISSDPVTYPTDWYQTGHNTSYPWDLCIKAYTTKITAPRVITGTVANVYTNHAEISTNVIESQGDAAITEKGICWNLSGNPTIDDDTTHNGTGNGSFNSVAIELQPSTKYYLKAFATNSSGTGYGEGATFTTPACDAEMTVLNNLDNGYGTLREALANICGGGTITISGDLDGETIGLTSGTLYVGKPTTLDNSNHTTGLTISGQTLSISSGNSLTLAPGSKITVSGSLQNNAGQDGLNIQSSAEGTASLIHNTSGVPATVQRYVAGTSAWHLVAAPVNNATANVFQGEYLQYYTEASATWTDIEDPGEGMDVAQGYAFWGTSGKDALYTFTGNLNNGNLSIGTTQLYEDPGDHQYYGWNLLGNPYPSAIDWSLLDDDWGAIYYWDHPNDRYASWVNGSGTNGGTQYVPPMQGFFVSSTGNDFEISNTDRAHNGTSAYFKNGQPYHIILQVTNGGYSDEVFIRFSNEATSGFDRRFDAWKLLSHNQETGQLYSFSGDNKLSVDVRPGCETIQLGFRSDKNAAFSFLLKEIADIPEAILEDTKTGTFHNLQSGSYDFIWNVTDNEKRFILHLYAVGIEETPAGKSDILIYASDGFIYINAGGHAPLQNNEAAHHVALAITDLTGRIVLRQDINLSDLISIPLNVKAGVYLVTVKSEQEVKTEKVFIK